jgi:fructose/tagatose bisphosphate aldolase
MHLLCFSNATLSSFLVFHGGSGSTREEIQTAVNNGVVKMNVDTGLYCLIVSV